MRASSRHLGFLDLAGAIFVAGAAVCVGAAWRARTARGATPAGDRIAVLEARMFAAEIALDRNIRSADARA